MVFVEPVSQHGRADWTPVLGRRTIHTDKDHRPDTVRPIDEERSPQHMDQNFPCLHDGSRSLAPSELLGRNIAASKLNRHIRRPIEKPLQFAKGIPARLHHSPRQHQHHLDRPAAGFEPGAFAGDVVPVVGTIPNRIVPSLVT